MQGASRVIVARMERHPYGLELVIAFEDGDDVIQTRLDRSATAALEQRAAEIRDMLTAKGWTVAVRAETGTEGRTISPAASVCERAVLIRPFQFRAEIRTLVRARVVWRRRRSKNSSLVS